MNANILLIKRSPKPQFTVARPAMPISIKEEPRD